MSGVRSSWAASARNARVCSSARRARVSAPSSSSSISSNACAVRPISVSVRLGASREPREPAAIRWARAAMASSGRRASRTATATRSPLSSSAASPLTSRIRRSVSRAPDTSEVFTLRVSRAPFTRPAPGRVLVTDVTPAPAGTVLPRTVPSRSSSEASTPSTPTRLTICWGRAPARASWRASCVRPLSRVSRLRFDCATKTALTEKDRATSTTASTAMTAAMTRTRTDTVARGLTGSRPTGSPGRGPCAPGEARRRPRACGAATTRAPRRRSRRSPRSPRPR